MALFDRFRTFVTVSATGEELVFRRSGNEVRQQPVVRVAPDGKIIEFGAAALATSGGQLIRFLHETSAAADSALRLFCRYQIKLVSPAPFGLRPRVIVHEGEIARAFGPEAGRRLENALVEDGFSVHRVSAI